ncbi:MAG TPA: ABC transporter permease [Gemmataceae bacterium]|nr:ABC transporter permease [Gemmataceae bacterium]
MTRLLGVALMVLILYVLLMGFFDKARSLDNHQVLARRLGFYGVLTLGVGVLIITGGIDLSIGSLVGLSAVAFGYLMNERHWQPTLAALIVVAGSVVIGLFHGLLVTALRLQPFLVTLCGLFMYRGLARRLSSTTVILPYESAQPQAEWLRSLLVSDTTLGLPHVLWLLGLLAVFLAVVLHGSVYGRYWYAIGYNEQAARYAGIATQRYKIAAYIISSTCAGLGGVVFLLEYRSATPSDAGSLLELYAITGAVLGGCNLRGGEGTVPGMVLGTAVLPLLSQICTTSRYIRSELEYTVIGGALLLATVTT